MKTGIAAWSSARFVAYALAVVAGGWISGCGGGAVSPAPTDLLTALPTLTDSPTSTATVVPSPTPDLPLEGNGRIAFASDRDGDFEIYSMEADGSDVAKLTILPDYDTNPSWSPDGTRIAFNSSRDGYTQIYVMNADGSDETRLTFDTENSSGPVWSPDGQHIAFHSNGDATASDIYIMDADGSNIVQVTSGPESDGEAAWSPDGTQIVFDCDSEGDGVEDICVMNADGSNFHALTNDPPVDSGGVADGEPAAAGITDVSPAWSPDGTQIAFVSDRDSSEDIYVMDVDGSNVIRLTDDPSSDTDPTWQPVAVTSSSQTPPAPVAAGGVVGALGVLALSRVVVLGGASNRK